MSSEHARLVREFLAQQARENPEKFKDVCDRNPVLSRHKLKKIHEYERNEGLLGLEPTSNSRLAYVNNLETTYDEDE